MNFFILSLIKTAIVAFALLTTLAYLQWIERKVLAHIQLRPGPYRVGPHGLLQPVADIIKLMVKEGLVPPGANEFFYLLAPFLAVTVCADLDRRHPLRPAGGALRCADQHGPHRPQHRRPVHPRHLLARRLWRGAGRLGVQ